MDYRFLFDQTDLATTIRVDFAGSGIYKTLFTFARYSLVLVIVDFFYKRNLKRDSAINIIGAFIPTLLNCLYVSNLSRIGIFAPLLSCAFLIIILFNTPKARKTILYGIGTIGLLFIIYLSFVKFFGEGRGDTSNATSWLWWGDTLNMYFTGIKETAIGIKAKSLINETYGLNRIALMFMIVFQMFLLLVILLIMILILINFIILYILEAIYRLVRYVLIYVKGFIILVLLYQLFGQRCLYI